MPPGRVRRTLARGGREFLTGPLRRTDTALVPKMIRTALLAVAALAAVGVAVTRTVNAAGGNARQAATAIYGASPTETAAALAKLQPPPGFERRRCRHPPRGSQTLCFHRARAVVLSDAAWAGLVTATGANVQRQHILPFRCIPPKPKQLAHTGGHVQICEAEGRIGRERLYLSASSVDPGRPSADRLNAKYQHEALSVWGRGTEIEAWVIGHRMRRE